MKRFLSNSFFTALYALISWRLDFYRWLNRKKKSVLIYSDSRGHEITHLYNKQNPFSSYAKYFIKNWRADVMTVPEKHTTFYDFLYHMENNANDYDHVIGHVGVVCFAPRPISQMEGTLSLKKQKIVSLFGEDVYNKLQAFEGYDVIYKGEKTSSLVPNFMLPLIAEKMNAIPNLIWINCNGVVKNWLGNYKERPENLHIVKDKSISLMNLLQTKNIIDITPWDNDEIKQYTCDNVHLTQAGMNYLEQVLRKITA